ITHVFHLFFFFSSRRRHTRSTRDWSSDVCSSDLDGNLHPNISFDATDPVLKNKVEAASAEIMQACIAAGGTITGEHGVGIDKMRSEERRVGKECRARWGPES